MTPVGRPAFGKAPKVRTTLTLDPDLIASIRKLEGKRANVSGFMEEAGWREVKRRKRSRNVGPKEGPKP